MPKLKSILADRGKSLFFEKDNMRLEITKKINLNSFTTFMMEVFVELIVAEYNSNRDGAKVAKYTKELINKISRLN